MATTHGPGTPMFSHPQNLNDALQARYERIRREVQSMTLDEAFESDAYADALLKEVKFGQATLDWGNRSKAQVSEVAQGRGQTGYLATFTAPRSGSRAVLLHRGLQEPGPGAPSATVHMQRVVFSELYGAIPTADQVAQFVGKTVKLYEPIISASNTTAREYDEHLAKAVHEQVTQRASVLQQLRALNEELGD